MSEAGMIGNQRNGTSVITETGHAVYNFVQDDDEISARRPFLGEAKMSEIAKNWPRRLCFTRVNKRAAKSKTNPLPTNGLLPVFQDFRGALHEDASQFRFCGEARTTNQHQGMPGREFGRVLAGKLSGTGTIVWRSTLPITARAIIAWNVPTSPNLPADENGLGARPAELFEWRSVDSVTQPLKLHEMINFATTARTLPEMTNVKNNEISAALIVWNSLKTIMLVASIKEKEVAQGSALTDTAKEDLAVLYGVIPPEETDNLSDAQRKTSIAFQKTLLDSVFMAAYNPQERVSHYEESLAVFTGDAASLISMRGRGNNRQKAVKREQISSVLNLTSGLANMVESKKQQIFAISLSSASPGQDIDVFYI